LEPHTLLAAIVVGLYAPAMTEFTHHQKGIRQWEESEDIFRGFEVNGYESRMGRSAVHESMLIILIKVSNVFAR